MLHEPMVDDLSALDATEQAALVRQGAVSPSELVEAALSFESTKKAAA